MIPWTQKRGRPVPRPKTGETPIRHVRVEDTLWEQIGEIAREQDRSVSAVVLDALKRYVTWYRRQQR
jgi:hypothetical protein